MAESKEKAQKPKEFVVYQKKAVKKFIKSCPKHIIDQYNALVKELKVNPRSCINKQLTNTGKPVYQHRIQSYRVLFMIDDGKVIVSIVKAGHRRDVYNNIDDL